MKITVPLLCLIIFCCFLTGIVCAEVPGYGNWTEITDNASFGPRESYGITVFDNRLWVIGGISYGGDNRLLNDVWSSPDGINWTLETEHAGFSPRSGHTVAAFDNRLWVIGGSGSNDVWSSPDGVNWTLETEHAGFSPRGYHGSAVFDNRLWVIGGVSSDSPTTFSITDDVWSSPNGINWTLETGHAEFGPRYGLGVTAADNRLWVIGGSWTNDVWSSPNGINWTQVNSGAPFKQMEFTPVTVSENRFWIVGGGSNPPPLVSKTQPAYDYHEIWSSADGKNWNLETEHAGFSPRFLHGVAVFRNSIWVIGGIGGSGNDVWYMPIAHSQIPPTSTATSQITSATVSITPTRASIDPLTVCFSLFIVIGLGYRKIRK